MYGRLKIGLLLIDTEDLTFFSLIRAPSFVSRVNRHILSAPYSYLTSFCNGILAPVHTQLLSLRCLFNMVIHIVSQSTLDITSIYYPRISTPSFCARKHHCAHVRSHASAPLFEHPTCSNTHMLSQRHMSPLALVPLSQSSLPDWIDKTFAYYLLVGVT